MKKGAKIGIGVVVLGGIIAASVIAAGNRDGGAVAVRMEPVGTRDLVASVTSSGWIRPFRRVDVQADIMGRITELNVKEGDNVRRGQVLLRIDPTQYEAAVARAEAMVREALSRESQTKANVLQAERAYERLRQLTGTDQNLVSRQQVEEAETQLAVQRELLTAAGFGVQQARSSLDEARDRLSKTVIRAPMDGVVTRLNVEEGSTAIVGTMNNPGSLLLTVADLSAMEAVVRVDETDLPEIEIGDSTSVTIDAFPRQKFTGRVTEISYSSVRSPLQQGAQASTQQGQAIDYEIVITLDDPPPALRSDLSVSAEIITAKKEKVLSIPIIALTVRERGSGEAIDNEDAGVRAAADSVVRRDSDDEEGVFVVREGKAKFVPVKVGIAGAEHFEVISGVTTSDTVVAGPYEAIRSLEEGKLVRNMVTAAPANGRATAAAKGN